MTLKQRKSRLFPTLGLQGDRTFWEQQIPTDGDKVDSGWELRLVAETSCGVGAGLVQAGVECVTGWGPSSLMPGPVSLPTPRNGECGQLPHPAGPGPARGAAEPEEFRERQKEQRKKVRRVLGMARWETAAVTVVVVEAGSP